MEDAYLFPLDVRKIVTAAPGRGFSWFGFVTLFQTALGVAAAGFRAWHSDTRTSSSCTLERGTACYFTTIFVLAAAALGVGVWWFVGGEGERRLREVLAAFPTE